MAEADLTLDSEAVAIQELTWFRRAGGGGLVEMSHPITVGMCRPTAGFSSHGRAYYLHDWVS